ncbi:hypothetical protein [Deinococcus sp.]|uniref:hypothetical protein n=1 Tax=Deinococcus sp. TaxID=47478 RepID=UPI003B59149E
MSILVSFFIGAPDGLLSHFLSGPLHDFYGWYCQVLEESPDEFSPAALHLLRQVINDGAIALERTSDFKSVDALLIDFYLMFTETLPDNHAHYLTYANDSWLSLYSYKAAIDIWKVGKELAVVELLNYMYTGRPLFRDSGVYPFFSGDGIVRLAYWTADETLAIAQALTDSTLSENESRLHNLASAANKAAEQQTGIIIVVA